MRILLALDGSIHADVARDLVAGMQLPSGSRVRVVAVLEPTNALLGGPWVPVIAYDSEEVEARVRNTLDQVISDARRVLERSEVAVETAVLRGHAASAIADDAATFGADLLVVGTRGHGPFQTMLLGSVSAELIDHATCPVLVARSSSVKRIALAHDGSQFAAAAASLLRDSAFFGKAAIAVVSVMPQSVVWAPAVPNAASASAAWERKAQDDRLLHEGIATTAVNDLRRAGHRADAVILEGHPAAAILEFVRRAGTDLLVLGTHGRTGLTRLMLGSIARTLVTHAPCSILVVRPQPAGGRQASRGRADGLVGAGIA